MDSESQDRTKPQYVVSVTRRYPNYKDEERSIVGATAEMDDLGDAIGSVLAGYIAIRQCQVLATAVRCTLDKPDCHEAWPGYLDACKRFLKAANDLADGWEASDCRLKEMFTNV